MKTGDSILYRLIPDKECYKHFPGDDRMWDLLPSSSWLFHFKWNSGLHDLLSGELMQNIKLKRGKR